MKYKTKDRLTELLNPDTGQAYALANPDRAYTSQAPTLRDADIIYGKATAEKWLVGQIANVCEFTGHNETMSTWQINNLARLIVAGYSWMKMSELLLFFGRFKTGYYGRFYGVLDPMVITSALCQFRNERSKALDRLQNEANARKDADEAKKPHYTYTEWKALKAQRDNNK